VYKEFPQDVVGRGGDEFNGCLFDWVRKGEAAGVQADSGIGIGAWGAIFEVAFDGAANGRQLGANLVVPSRKKFDFNKVIPIAAASIAVLKQRFLGSGFGSEMGVRFILVVVTHKVVCKHSRQWLWFVHGDRPILFLHISGREHLV